jgi:hypothetical protein
MTIWETILVNLAPFAIIAMMALIGSSSNNDR